MNYDGQVAIFLKFNIHVNGTGAIHRHVDLSLPQPILQPFTNDCSGGRHKTSVPQDFELYAMEAMGHPHVLKLGCSQWAIYMCMYMYV